MLTIRHYLFAVVVMVAFFGSLILIAQAAERWSPWTMPVPTVTATPTTTPTSTPTAAATPTSTATPTTPPTASPVPEQVREVYAPPPPAVVSGNAAALPLPDGTSVRFGGCASDGECHWYNFYWGPTHEVVMQPGEGQHKVQHERCHAHQHWSINGGADLLPSDYDLESWYATAEGQSFMAAVAGLPFPWTHSAVNGLEDFAWTCAYWYLDPERLVTIGGQARYDWVRENLS